MRGVLGHMGIVALAKRFVKHSIYGVLAGQRHPIASQFLQTNAPIK